MGHNHEVSGHGDRLRRTIFVWSFLPLLRSARLRLCAASSCRIWHTKNWSTSRSTQPLRSSTYGLSIAAHFRRGGIPFRIFGRFDQLTRTKNAVKRAMDPAQLAEAERGVHERLKRSRAVEPAGSTPIPFFYERRISA